MLRAFHHVLSLHTWEQRLTPSITAASCQVVVGSNEVPPQSLLLHTKHWHSQAIFINLIFLSLRQIHCSSLCRLSQPKTLLLVAWPNLNTVFVVQSHQCCVLRDRCHTCLLLFFSVLHDSFRYSFFLQWTKKLCLYLRNLIASPNLALVTDPI